MTASRHATDHASRLMGETDFARVDAHVVGTQEYDEIPELTDAMIARSVPGSDPDMVRRGRPVAENRKRLVSIRLDPDLLDALRATGPGWQTRVNDALRDWLNRAP